MCRVTQGPEFAWIYLNSSWIYLNLLECPRICVNMPKFVWMAFVLYFLIVIPGLLERVITYMKLEAIVWRSTMIFTLTRQNLIFSIVAGSIWFHFCFRLNIFTTKISNLLLPLGVEGPRAMNLNISTLKSWTTTKHWNQINRGQFKYPATSIKLF